MHQVTEPIVKVERPKNIVSIGPCETAPIQYVEFKKKTHKYKPKPIEPMVTRTGCKPKRLFIKPFEWELEEERNAQKKVAIDNAAKYPRERAQTRASSKTAKSPKAEVVKENSKSPEVVQTTKKQRLNTYLPDNEVGLLYSDNYKLAIEDPIILAAADNNQSDEVDPYKEIFEQLQEYLIYFSQNPVIFDNNHSTKVTATNNLHTIIPNDNTPIPQPSISHIEQEDNPLVVAAKITPSRRTSQIKRTKKQAPKKTIPFMNEINLYFHQFSSYIRH